MAKAVRSLLNDSGPVGQIIRFALSGGVITVAASISYWLLAEFAKVPPALSLGIVYIVFTFIGFFVHSQFSFNGHGDRSKIGLRGMRYFVSAIAGFALNQFFVWFFIQRLGLPVWTPILTFLFVTPIVLFLLNRQWVFAKAG